jgi:hypothetical protein
VNEDNHLGDKPQADETNRWRTYLSVAVLEVVVIVALWSFGRYFGSL